MDDGLRTLAASLRSLDGQPSSGLLDVVRGLQLRVADELDDWWSRAANDGPIQIIDMFSGCGGMSAGFRAINGVVPAFRQVLGCDIDTVANLTYEHNLGLAPVAGDIARLSKAPSRWKTLLSKAGRRDGPLVMIGCAPCQGFSSHRNAAGRADPRNDLFGDFVTLALRADPDVVLIENVPELCTDEHWPRVAEARRRFEKAGYSVHLTVHNMAEFGVPQERFRALMTASKRPFVPVAGHLTRQTFRTVRQAIGHLPAVTAGAVGTDPMHCSAGHRSTTIDLIRSVPVDGGSRPPGSGPASLRALAQRQGKEAYEDIYGRLWWDRPAITMTAYARNPASGRFVHPEQHRGLTVREAALLQGFPGDYHFHGGFDVRFRQIGNAVPPIFAACLALNVIANLVSPPVASSPVGLVEPVGRSFSRLIPALKAGTRELANT